MESRSIVFALAPAACTLWVLGRRTTGLGQSLGLDELRAAILIDFRVKLSEDEVGKIIAPMITSGRVLRTPSGRLTAASVLDPVLA
jgi:hypothetical protein